MTAHSAGKKLLSWASDVEQETLTQARRTARLPFVVDHVALMPDAHVGAGSTVGSVIPTEGAIIPAAVGVDIGCGMVAAETSLTAADLPDSLGSLMPLIEKRIPAGVGKGHAYGAGKVDASYGALGRPHTELSTRQADTAALQFGTLGSGNHFVEVCLDERDVVWTVLHSGSRGIGNQLAQKHIGAAKGLMKERFISLEDPDLAYLVEGEASFTAYIDDMLWAQRYAMASRAVMSAAATRSLFEVVGRGQVKRTVNCFAGETRVMTSTGHARIDTLAGGEHELLTTGGAWVKAPVVAFGRQPLVELIVSRNGVRKSILTTKDHRWFLRTHSSGGTRYWGKRPAEATTSELRPGDRLAFTFPLAPESRTVDRDWAARGFTFGDGSRHGNRSIANFCGAKDRQLLPLFENRGNAPRTYGAVTRVTGLPVGWKTEAPAPSAPAQHIYGWLAGYFAADGDVGKTGRPTLSSANADVLQIVRTLCDAVGVGTFGIRRRNRLGIDGKLSDIFLLGLMRGDLTSDFFLLSEHRRRFESGRSATERRGWTVTSVNETERIEEVFCAVVEGTHAFALEDNILTSNCHHNFTQRETHHGRELWITRKGAIKADVGDEGVIPGSMGTRSYVTEGLGNPSSWMSSSHGAGRRLSRGAARRQLTVSSLKKAMDGKDWLEGDAERLLDEHPAAYKDIDQVMADQTDLVRVQHTLRQVFNYKGL